MRDHGNSGAGAPRNLLGSITLVSWRLPLVAERSKASSSHQRLTLSTCPSTLTSGFRQVLKRPTRVGPSGADPYHLLRVASLRHPSWTSGRPTPYRQRHA